MKKALTVILFLAAFFILHSCATPPARQIESSGSAVESTQIEVTAEAENGKVHLKWTGEPGEKYNVYMSMTPGASRKNFDGRKKTKTNSYSWAGLTNGTKYYFVVTKESKEGESEESNEIAVTPNPKGKKEGKKAAVKPVEPAEEPAQAEETAPEEPKHKAAETHEQKAPKKTAKKEKSLEQPAAEPPAAREAPPAQEAKSSSKMSAQDLLMKADEIRAPGKSFVQDVRVTFKKGSTETVNRLATRVRGFTKSLAIYKEPASQKDQVILMVGNNMWIYFPSTKNPIRISPAQQLLGQVSNADVARVVYNLDYKAESVEDDTIGGEKVYKLMLKAKTEGAAYGSIKLWMNRGNYRPNKAEFYTLAGRLLKTIYYKGYKQILGKERPTIHEIHDAVKKDEVTTMEYLSMKIEDTPENYFQKTFMHRASGL